jgi:hypothetical protein
MTVALTEAGAIAIATTAKPLSRIFARPDFASPLITMTM